MAKRIVIRVINPRTGGRGYTSHHRALRFVNAGRAEWTDNSHAEIRIFASDPPCSGRDYDIVASVSAAQRSRTEAERERALSLAPGSHTDGEWIQLQRKYDYHCLRCGIRADQTFAGRLTRDHITPLSCGGSNSISNIQPLCRSCNKVKGNRDVDFRNGYFARRAGTAGSSSGKTP
jgi:hypothetical protein